MRYAPYLPNRLLKTMKVWVRALIHDHAAFLFRDVHPFVVLAVWLLICEGDNTKVYACFFFTA